MIRSLQLITLLCCCALFASCQEELHVRVYPGQCQGAGVEAIRSFYTELRRTDGVGVQRCFSPMGKLLSVADLEKSLADGVSFDELPSGGRWTLWLVGSSTECYSSEAALTLLCGRADNFELSGGTEVVNVLVDCEYPLSAPETQQKIKESIKTCKSGFHPLAPGE